MFEPADVEREKLGKVRRRTDEAIEGEKEREVQREREARPPATVKQAR